MLAEDAVVRNAAPEGDGFRRFDERGRPANVNVGTCGAVSERGGERFCRRSGEARPIRSRFPNAKGRIQPRKRRLQLFDGVEGEQFFLRVDSKKQAALAGVGDAARLLFPTDGLWRGVIYGLEPSQMVVATQMGGRVAASNPFFADQPPPTLFIVWCVAWIALVLALGAWLFRRREL